MQDPPGEKLSKKIAAPQSQDRLFARTKSNGSDWDEDQGSYAEPHTSGNYNGSNNVKTNQKYDKIQSVDRLKNCSHHSDDVTASETDTTDDSTLFYITCPKKHKDDDRDNMTIEPHLYQWDREQEENFRRQSDDATKQQEFDLTDELDCKAQIGDFETTVSDDEADNEWFDERSLESLAFTRVSVLGKFESTNRTSIPLVKAIPVTNSKHFQNQSFHKATIYSSDNRSEHRKYLDKSNCSDSVLDSMSWLSSVSTTFSQTQILMLRQDGFPLGLSEQLMDSKSKFPIRFWLVDNSGSMRSLDGHQLRRAYITPTPNDPQQHNNPQYISDAFQGMQKSKTFIASCSRWTELQGAVIDNAQLSGLLGMPTVFRLLNDPGQSIGKQELSVGLPTTKSNGVTDPYTDVSDVVHLVHRTKPEGGTPLTVHLLEIRKRIDQIHTLLLSKGQATVVVIATDGLPTDDNGNTTKIAQHQFLEALRSFRTMPVWIVIRLCTDDQDVARYYNDLDKEVELPMEVLDDFLGESKEIYRFNPWLNYAMPLHQCREMGFHHRTLDLLDERALDKDELHQFLLLLFGVERFKNSPNIHSNWKEYKNFISSMVKNAGKLWCPSTGKTEYWINMTILNRIYGPQSYFGWTLGRKKESSGKGFGFTFWKRPQEHKSQIPIDESVEVQQRREQLSMPLHVTRVKTNFLQRPASPPGRGATTRNTLTSIRGARTLDPPASVSPNRNEDEFFNDNGSFPQSCDEFTETYYYEEETVDEDSKSGLEIKERTGIYENKSAKNAVEAESISDSTIYIESTKGAEIRSVAKSHNSNEQMNFSKLELGNSVFQTDGQIRGEKSTIAYQKVVLGPTIAVEKSVSEETIEEDASVIEESVYEEETVSDEDAYEDETIE